MDLMSDRIRCPYDENHIVDPLRMPYHLMKCRKNFPNIQLAVCPYSALHEVPPMELQYHMANCPDKRLVEGVDPPHALLHSLSGKEPDMLKGCTDIPPPVNVKFGDGDLENWDDDIDYVINQASSSQPFVIHHRRRLHRNDEVKNLSSSRNTLPGDFQMRRPISQSVAERLKPGSKCDLSQNDSFGKSFLESPDLSTDSLIQKTSVSSQCDSVQTLSTESTPNSKFDTCPDFSSHSQRITGYNISTAKDVSIIKTNHQLILQGRGRSSLLASLDDPSRVERRPGSKQSFSMIGRGRFLSKVQVQANQ